MGIDRIQWEQIKSAKATGRALSAGYPDLLVDLPGLPKRLQSREVGEHHGMRFALPESRAAFRQIGLDLEIFDRETLEGSEYIRDLNEPHDFGEFDLVIDPGTSEHCFNIPQALVNLAGAVKVDGYISQALPMAMFNHGYWNVNPVALLDFYEQNGFHVKQCVLRHEDGIFHPVGRERYKAVPDGTVISLLAQRAEKRPFRWPQQNS